jgi:hypothetical protein
METLDVIFLEISQKSLKLKVPYESDLEATIRGTISFYSMLVLRSVALLRLRGIVFRCGRCGCQAAF